MINSLFGDETRSWVMIVNGINKYVTEMTEETQENHIDEIGDSTGKLITKARPKQTPSPTSSFPTITLPYHQRQWIDVEPGKFDKNSVEVSKKMIRLLRDNVLLPNDFAEHIYHVGSSHDLHSIIQSGLIPSGKDIKKGRHAVFFTAVNPM